MRPFRPTVGSFPPISSRSLQNQQPNSPLPLLLLPHPPPKNTQTPNSQSSPPRFNKHLPWPGHDPPPPTHHEPPARNRPHRTLTCKLPNPNHTTPQSLSLSIASPKPIPSSPTHDKPTPEQLPCNHPKQKPPNLLQSHHHQEEIRSTDRQRDKTDRRLMRSKWKQREEHQWHHHQQHHHSHYCTPYFILQFYYTIPYPTSSPYCTGF